MSVFKDIKKGLNKTSSFLTSNIIRLVKSKQIDQEIIDEIESILISADIGLEVTNLLIEKIKKLNNINSDKSIEIIDLFAKEIEFILKDRQEILISDNNLSPTILIFIGVNGSGKTTTIGKLVNKIPNNKKILIGACDTFRAAAIDQLNKWTNKENIDFYKGISNQDPASVAFEAMKKTNSDKYDYLLIDTAGRLSNNTNLLNQLVKIKSVINKTNVNGNIKTILVLDGTNGSNMINQVDVFNQSIDINGLIITKIDGTAKGGALISIAKKYEIPIHFVGLGENEDDLYQFDAKKFAYSIFDLEY